MKIIKLPLEWFTARLVTGTPFSFSRYGDGEFQAILGHQGRTKDGQLYTPELREALAKTLLEPRAYKYAVGPMAMRMHGPDILAWLAKENIHIKWYDTETLLEASIAGELKPFIDALRQRRVRYFAPRHLAQIANLLPNAYLYPCNSKNAFGGYDDLLLTAAQEVKSGDVVLLSCGPAAKVLLHDLYNCDSSLTILDIGSLLDPYVGRISRSYMSRYNWGELTKKNFGV